MAGTLAKLAGADRATVVERATLSAEALATLQGSTDVADAIVRLEASGFAPEAVRVMAHALPKREGVWWACMCAVNTMPDDLPAEDRRARETAELWGRQEKKEQPRTPMTHA